MKNYFKLITVVGFVVATLYFVAAFGFQIYIENYKNLSFSLLSLTGFLTILIYLYFTKIRKMGNPEDEKNGNPTGIQLN